MPLTKSSTSSFFSSKLSFFLYLPVALLLSFYLVPDLPEALTSRFPSLNYYLYPTDSLPKMAVNETRFKLNTGAEIPALGLGS